MGNIMPAQNHHVSIVIVSRLTWALSSKHSCAQVQPRSAAGRALCLYVSCCLYNSIVGWCMLPLLIIKTSMSIIIQSKWVVHSDIISYQNAQKSRILYKSKKAEKMSETYLFRWVKPHLNCCAGDYRSSMGSSSSVTFGGFILNVLHFSLEIKYSLCVLLWKSVCVCVCRCANA